MRDLLARFREWRKDRQHDRCARGWHHWKSLTPDRIVCMEPGCGKRYGQ